MSDYLDVLMKDIPARLHIPLKQELADVAQISNVRDLHSYMKNARKVAQDAIPGDDPHFLQPVLTVAANQRLLELEDRATPETTTDTKAFDQLVDNAIAEADQPGMTEALKKAQQGIPTIAETPDPGKDNNASDNKDGDT